MINLINMWLENIILKIIIKFKKDFFQIKKISFKDNK